VHGFSAFLVDAISSILIVPWNVIAPSSSCQPFSDADWIGQTISAHGLYSYLGSFLPWHDIWQIICSDDSYFRSQKECDSWFSISRTVL